MSERISLPKVAPETYAAIRDLDAIVRRSGLEQSLIELVKMRVVNIWNRVAVGLAIPLPRAA